MDRMTKEQRSKCMGMIVRKALYKEGFRYLCQPTKVGGKKMPGHPDIVLPKYRTIIEVRGCFWHRHEGCRLATMPATNVEFWTKKFADNVARDKRHEDEWAALGWRVFVVWECALKGGTCKNALQLLTLFVRKFPDWVRCEIGNLNDCGVIVHAHSTMGGGMKGGEL